MRMIKLKVHRRANYEYILSEERESWYTGMPLILLHVSRLKWKAEEVKKM